MSSEEPTEPYVYQPFGLQDEARVAAGRLWGVGGVGSMTTITGLTKHEAELVREMLREQQCLVEILGDIDS